MEWPIAHQWFYGMGFFKWFSQLRLTKWWSWWDHFLRGYLCVEREREKRRNYRVMHGCSKLNTEHVFMENDGWWGEGDPPKIHPASRFVEPRYRDAPKRSRDGQWGAHQKYVFFFDSPCFFSRVDIHPWKFDMDIHDCCIFKQVPFSNHHFLSNFNVFWGVHLFFILTLYVWKSFYVSSDSFLALPAAFFCM